MSQPKIVAGMLVDPKGLTLYTFDNDVAGSGKSVCNPPCSNIFRPYLANEKSVSKGDYSVIMRVDGSSQWAYKGRPLYLWLDDKKPGQTGGDGMNHNIWHVARP